MYVRTKNQKENNQKKFFQRLKKSFLFWKKDSKKVSTSKLYIGNQQVKKYAVTYNRGKQIIVYARTFTEAKDKAYSFLKGLKPNKKIKLKKVWEVIEDIAEVFTDAD